MSDKKTALVTGASTGIGRAIAITLAKEGLFVILVARRIDKLLETKKMIGDAHASDAMEADLSTLNGINNLVATVKEKYQHIDILVNVAGIWHGETEVYADKDFEAFDQQVILDTFMVGTIAPTLLSHAFVPLMHKGSSIINISGTFESGAKGWLPYYVSKRAIEDLTIGLSEELQDKGIKVNGISPSDTATEEYKKYFPQYIQDANDPKDIAVFVTKLCSFETTETGKVYVIKKGEKPIERFHA